MTRASNKNRSGKEEEDVDDFSESDDFVERTQNKKRDKK